MNLIPLRNVLIPHHDALCLSRRHFGALLGERDDVRGDVSGIEGVQWGCEDSCGGGRWVSGGVLVGTGGDGRGDERGKRGTDLRRLRIE